MASAGTVFKNEAQGSKLATANSKFALELYLRQAGQKPGNVFISPLSISVALAMTYLGARNNTKAQMRDVLKFGEVEEAHLHQVFEDLRLHLNKPSQPYTLYMANRLFGEQSYKFLDDFLNLSRKHYGADLAAVDFKSNANGCAGQINSWVAENTNKMIRDLIAPGILNDLTRLVLVNAIYFKGNWASKFDRALTRPTDFHVTPTETIQVDMMHMRDVKYMYGSNHELVSQAIELPYVDNALSMFIILPDPSVSLADVEKKLTIDALSNIHRHFSMAERKLSHVWVPRFRLEEKLELSGTLAAMGMGDAFDEKKADMSGLDGTRELYISKVIHQAVVEVNEEGTEAAAATAVVMMMRCAMVNKEFEFRADHPFLFFIRDNTTNSVLFLGRVVKPEKLQTKDEL